MPDEWIQRKLQEPDRCYGCGADNPSGLHLRFRRLSETEVVTEATLPEDLCGWVGVAHGGFVALLMDEITSWAFSVCLGEERYATRELRVCYERPTPVGVPLTVTGWVDRDDGRAAWVIGEIRLPDGRLTARGQVEIVRLDEDQYSRFEERKDD